MYLGIDIGGTKTLLASFSEAGEMLGKIKFPTSKNYDQFISDLEKTAVELTTKNSIAIGVAVPGLLSREKGMVFALGNLPWRNKPIRDDISTALGNLPVIIENDARLAGLAEAVLLKSQYQNVLYLTISTGIGGALLRDGHIVKELEDTEMGKMPLQFEGKLTHWEDFASGRAIVERFGKRASEIDDPRMWQEIGTNIAYGIGALCSVLQPEVIVFGGGAGVYAAQFKTVVADYLDKNLHPVVKRPDTLLVAQHKNDGGIYGCYEIVKQYYGQSA